MDMVVEAGDEIWVPENEYRDWWSITKETFTIIAQVTDEDSGVQSVWVTYENRLGHWVSKQLARVPGTVLWQGQVTSALDTFNYFVQAVDNAGNTAVSSNKGVYFAAAPKLLHMPIIYRNAGP